MNNVHELHEFHETKEGNVFKLDVADLEWENHHFQIEYVVNIQLVEECVIIHLFACINE